MRNLIMATSALALIPALALALSVNDPVCSDQASVESALSGMGYEVLEVEAEHGLLEVDALKDGANVELTVDLASGLIVEIERADEDGDGDDAEGEDDRDEVGGADDESDTDAG